MARYKDGLTLIPDHMHEGMIAYIETGRRPGSFLSAVLSNDFMAAADRADTMNLEALTNYILYLKLYAPAGCHSSHSNFEYWCQTGGLAVPQLRVVPDPPPSADGAIAPGQRGDASNPPTLLETLGSALRPDFVDQQNDGS